MTAKPSPSKRSKPDETEAAIVAFLRRSAIDSLTNSALKMLAGADGRDDATAAHVMMTLSIAVERKQYALDA